MKRKIAICLFILGILTVLTFVGCADREEYALAKGEGGVIIKDYRGKGGVISVPSEIDGKKVVGIGEFAFANCQGITEVVIPDGVREIGAYAFVNSSKITRITLPKNEIVVGEYAFSGCSSLVEINIGQLTMRSPRAALRIARL